MGNFLFDFWFCVLAAMSFCNKVPAPPDIPPPHPPGDPQERQEEEPVGPQHPG